MSLPLLPLILFAPEAAHTPVRQAFAHMGWDIMRLANPTTPGIGIDFLQGASIILAILDPETEEALESFGDALYETGAETLFDEMSGKESWESSQWQRHLEPKIKASIARLNPIVVDQEPRAAPGSLVEQEAEVLAFDLGFSLSDTQDTDAAPIDSSVENPGFSSDFVFTLADPPSETAEESTSAAPVLDLASEFGEMRFLDTDFEPTDPTHARAQPSPSPEEDFGQMSFVDDYPAVMEQETAITPGLPSTQQKQETTLPATSYPPSELSFGNYEENEDLPALTFQTHLPEPLDEADRDHRALVEAMAPEGAVIVLGGAGGPAALRQLLESMDPGLLVPVVIHQDLPQGRHDVFANNLKKNITMEVAVAVAGQILSAGKAWLLPEGLAAISENGQWTAQEGVVDTSLLEAGATQSVVVVLSGASPQLTFPAMEAISMGAVFFGQDPKEAYEPQLISTLQEIGLVATESFEELSLHINEHWGCVHSLSLVPVSA